MCEGASEQAADDHHQGHKTPGGQGEEPSEATAIASGTNPVDNPSRCSVEHQPRFDDTDRKRTRRRP